MKAMSLRLDDVSVKRLEELKEHKSSEFIKFSYNDLIRLAIRCLYEDEGLDKEVV